MRLLVHSLWQCNKDNCHGYPLRIEVCEGQALQERREKRQLGEDLTAIEVIPQEFKPELVQAMLEKIVEYDSLVQTARDLNITVPLERPTDDVEELRQLHHALFECHIIEGILHCPKCDHQFPISNGIPDFVDPS